MTQPDQHRDDLSINASYIQDLSSISPTTANTPFLHPMDCTLEAIFNATRLSITKLTGPSLVICVPCDAVPASKDSILHRALATGFLAACTNQLEQRHAVNAGFPESRIVLSGPAKFWPSGLPKSSLHTLLCDSSHELDALANHIRAGERIAEYVGATIRLEEHESRMGIPISASGGLDDLCARLRKLPPTQKLALEFHADASRIGVDFWSYLANRFLDFVSLTTLLLGRPVSCLAIVGEWFSEDWIFAIEGPIAGLASRIAQTLPGVTLVILDSGRAFTQPSHSLVTRVIGVRRNPFAELVVDASVTELPDLEIFVHRIVWLSAGDGIWRELPSGKAQILGRRNREHDILSSRVEIPESLRPGDLLAFLDVEGSP